MSLPPTPEWTAALQKMHVTYHLSLLPSAPAALRHSPDPLPLGPSITLLESRALISAGGTTGLRTWEAALHLGQYLCANPFLVSGRRVLELGAGTGYLSVLCALHLGARHVLASDGSADVVASLADAISLRRLQGGRDGEVKMAALQLQWGHALLGAELAPWHGGRGVDLVLGADVTYDARVIPALVTTLQDLVRLFPDVLVLVAATERNKETYEVFMAACRAGPEALEVTMVEEFPVPARAEQMGPFYEDRVPIHICRIGRQRPEDGPAS